MNVELQVNSINLVLDGDKIILVMSAEDSGEEISFPFTKQVASMLLQAAAHALGLLEVPAMFKEGKFDSLIADRIEAINAAEN